MLDKNEGIKADSVENNQEKLERILSELREVCPENKELIDSNRAFFGRLKLDQYMLNSFLKNISDMVYFKDKNSRFIKISKSMSSRFDVQNVQSLIGKTDFDIQDEVHAKEAFIDEQEIVNTGKSRINIIEKEKHKSGDRWVSSSKLPFIDNKGEIIGVFGISRDMSELINLQNELKQKNEALNKAEELLVEQNIELEELNKNKDKFLSIIAHDLKNPIASIVSYFDILSRNYEQIDEEDKKDIIKELTKISSNTFNLLEDLLNWSELQRGKITIKKEVVDLKLFIDDKLLALVGNAKLKEITIYNNINEGLHVNLDKRTMSVVFTNIVSNAIKFTDSSGSIKISAAIDGEMMKISFVDNGVGMHENTIQSLFSLNKMESTLGTNYEKGTGLGLILCKEFIEKNDGVLQIESEKGKGTKIQVLLPFSL